MEARDTETAFNAKSDPKIQKKHKALPDRKVTGTRHTRTEIYKYTLGLDVRWK